MNYFHHKNNRTHSKDELLIFGIRPVMEAMKSGKNIEKILIQNGLNSETFGMLWQLIKELQINYQFVPAEKLKRITTKNHQGVIAFVSLITYYNMEDIIPFVFEKGKIPLIIILDRITDVRNFGAIARTAECTAVDCIIIPEKNSAQINSDAIKTSAGALMKIPVCRVQDIKQTIHYLKHAGICIIACTEKSDFLYHDFDFKIPAAILIGSEENGISPELLKLSDQSVSIPLLGEISSLNVSVATAVILYEIIRQRKTI